MQRAQIPCAIIVPNSIDMNKIIYTTLNIKYVVDALFCNSDAYCVKCFIAPLWLIDTYWYAMIIIALIYQIWPEVIAGKSVQLLWSSKRLLRVPHPGAQYNPCDTDTRVPTSCCLSTQRSQLWSKYERVEYIILQSKDNKTLKKSVLLIRIFHPFCHTRMEWWEAGMKTCIFSLDICLNNSLNLVLQVSKCW